MSDWRDDWIWPKDANEAVQLLANIAGHKPEFKIGDVLKGFGPKGNIGINRDLYLQAMVFAVPVGEFNSEKAAELIAQGCEPIMTHPEPKEKGE